MDAPGSADLKCIAICSNGFMPIWLHAAYLQVHRKAKTQQEQQLELVIVDNEIGLLLNIVILPQFRREWRSIFGQKACKNQRSQLMQYSGQESVAMGRGRHFP